MKPFRAKSFQAKPFHAKPCSCSTEETRWEPSSFRANGFRKRIALLSTGALTALSLAACSLHDRVASVDNTFLEDVDVSQKLVNIPYDHAWVRPGFDGRVYPKLYLKPIRLDKLGENAWMKSASSFITSRESYLEEAKEIADYLQEQLVKQINEYPNPSVTLVDRPDERTLTLEIALTELEFSHPIARAAALAAPVPGTGPALSAMSDPHVAFAARITDETGRLAVTAADRKFPPTRIIDLNKLTITSSPREVCALWAKTMAEALNKRRFSKTKDNGKFSLLPW